MKLWYPFGCMKLHELDYTGSSSKGIYELEKGIRVRVVNPFL